MHGFANELRFSEEEYALVYEAIRDYGFHNQVEHIKDLGRARYLKIFHNSTNILREFYYKLGKS